MTAYEVFARSYLEHVGDEELQNTFRQLITEAIQNGNQEQYKAIMKAYPKIQNKEAREAYDKELAAAAKKEAAKVKPKKKKWRFRKKALAGVITVCAIDIFVMNGCNALLHRVSKTGTQKEVESNANDDYEYKPIETTYEEEPIDGDITIYRQVAIDSSNPGWMEAVANDYGVDPMEIEMCNDVGAVEYGYAQVPYNVYWDELADHLYTVECAQGESLEEIAIRTETAVTSLQDINQDAIVDGQLVANYLEVPDYHTLTATNVHPHTK